MRFLDITYYSLIYTGLPLHIHYNVIASMNKSRSMVYSILSCMKCFQNQSKSHVMRRMKPGECCRYVSANSSNYYKHSARPMDDKTTLVRADTFDKVPQESRKKETFISMCRGFNKSVKNDIYKTNHVEFILKAVAEMENFGVHRDIDCYNAILDCFPKDVMVPENKLQVAFNHFPRQQECCLKVLEKMSSNSLVPDKRTYLYIRDSFGEEVHPMRKLQRMMYWHPKFMNSNPYIRNLPSIKEGMPDDALLLAILALERMAVDKQNKITVFNSSEVADSADDTFIASAQSPEQIELVSSLSAEHAVFVCGPYNMWLRWKCAQYFILIGEYSEYWPHPQQRGLYDDPREYEDVGEWEIPMSPSGEATRQPPPETCSVHEQSDHIVLAMCVTGTSTLDSLRSWIKLLQRDNPHLAHVPVLFRIKSEHADVALREKLLHRPRKGSPLTKPVTTILVDHH